MVDLYINNKKVDCTEDVSIDMTYQQTDYTNPTAIKNPYSATIAIPRTSNNDLLFDCIYRTDRRQTVNTFNPSKRVPFVILNNGELIESGYMQLISVTKDSYNITLYGTLGDFFYNLTKKDDGTNMTLADLKYTDDDDTYFTFNINKTWVYDSFNGSETGLHSFLKFIPTYNGLYEDFDNSACLVNTSGTAFPTSNGEYTTYNGYGLAKLNNEYTEWEMRDLRSYKQRPAIRFKTLFQTILNNSGYETELDSNWFNEKNPYWEKTFVALPLLDSSYSVDSTDDTLTPDMYSVIFTKAIPEGYGYLKDPVDISGYTTSTSYDVTVVADYSITWNGTPTWGGRTALGYFNPKGPTNYTINGTGSMISTQLLAYDENDNIVGTSNEIVLTSYYQETTSGTRQPFTVNDLNDYTQLYPAGRVYRIGSFTADGKFDGGEVTYTIKELQNISGRQLKLRLYARSFSNVTDGVNTRLVLYDTTSGDKPTKDLPQSYGVIVGKPAVNINVSEQHSIATNTTITKDLLLTTNKTPCEYLLSYCKLFGLYFDLDRANNKIKICSRNSFYENKLNDYTQDESKDSTVSIPIFSSDNYIMRLETPETKFSNKYNKRYDIDYGQQRIKTGFEFSSDITELLSDNIFNQVVPATDSSKYYRDFYTSGGLQKQPCFLVDNAEWTLYKTVTDSSTQTLYGSEYIKNVTDWSYVPGADDVYKMCCTDEDNNSVDCAPFLVFYDGMKSCKDYYITDDLPEMYVLNKERCFLYTNTVLNAAGERIAYKMNTIPMYNSYLTTSGFVTDSLDIGWPKEWYIQNLEYPDNVCIYPRFNKAYYNDLFDVNTRKIVSWGYINNLDFHKFYNKENTTFVLNKANDYSKSCVTPQQFEFIKVNVISNYTNGQIDYSLYLTLTGSNSVSYNAGSWTGKVSATDPWTAEYTNCSGPESGVPGDNQNLKITFDDNDSWGNRYLYVKVFINQYNLKQVLEITHLPKLSNTRPTYIDFTSGYASNWNKYYFIIRADDGTSSLYYLPENKSAGKGSRISGPRNLAYTVEQYDINTDELISSVDVASGTSFVFLTF